MKKPYKLVRHTSTTIYGSGRGTWLWKALACAKNLGLNRGLVLKSVVGIVVGLFLALAGTPVAAQTGPGSFSAEALSPATINAEPRRPATVSVRITNTSSAAISVANTLATPEGWGYLAMPDVSELAPGAQQVVFFSVNVPNNAPAGDYNVQAIHSTASTERNISSVVGVAAVEAIFATLSRATPQTVLSGDSFSHTFLLTNLGNASSTVSIEIESRPEWETVASTTQLTLASGESGEVVVSITAPEELPNAVTHRVTLKAHTSSSTEEKPAARVSASADVVPQSLGAESVSMHAELTGEFSNQAAWSENDSEMRTQHSLTLGGKMREGEEVQINLNLPSLTGSDSGGFSDELRASFDYSNDEWGSLSLGDSSVNLRARLLKSNISGRGVELTFGNEPEAPARKAPVEEGGEAEEEPSNEATEVRLFYMEPTRSSGDQTTGLQFIQHFDENNNLRLTALDSSGQSNYFGADPLDEHAKSYSIYGEAMPGEDWYFTGEAAQSKADYAGSGTATRFTGRYRGEQVTLGGEYILASRDFYGAWDDEEFYRTDLSWNLTKEARFWANYSQSRDNIDDEPTEPGRRQQRLQLGTSLRLGGNTSLRITRDTDNDTDVLWNAFDDRTVSTEYQLTNRWDDFKLTTSWEDERDEDQLTGIGGDAQRLRLYGSLDIDDKSALTFNLSQEDSRIDGGESRASTQLGVGGTFTTGEDSDQKLDLRQSKSQGSSNTTWVSGAWREKLGNGHELNLRLQYNTGGFGNATAVALDYAIPLNVPVKWIDVKGAAQGRIYMAHDTSLGVAGVLVSLGSHQVVTDEDGNFSFAGLEPGELVLNVSSGALGVGLSLDIALPMPLAITAGQTEDVQIPVVASTGVSGKVTIEIPGALGQAPGIVPLADVVIELRGMEQTSYRLTNGAGRFVFSDLRPGSYTVVLRTEGLPRYHETDVASYQVELVPGESQTGFEFKITPVVREIQITTGLD